MYIYCQSTKAGSETPASVKLRGKLLKERLKEWFEFEKDGELPSYAVYSLLHIFKHDPEIKEDSNFLQNLKEYLVQQNPKAMKEASIHPTKLQTIFDLNRTTSLYKNENDTKNNTEFKLVEK